MSEAKAPSEEAYALATTAAKIIAAPELPYRPPRAKSYAPGIALVGAGRPHWRSHILPYRDPLESRLDQGHGF
jgi:hypothetical protein